MAERSSNKSVLSTDAKLGELVNRLKEVAAVNLESVILYGSAARGDFHPGALRSECLVRAGLASH